MRLPDSSNSYAILFGTSSYQSNDLPNLPAIQNNLDDLAAVLSDPEHGGFLRDHCRVMNPPSNPAAVAREIQSTAPLATDTLLIYFSGHGCIGKRSGQLYFAFNGTDPEILGTTAMSFDDIQEMFLESAVARNKILIIDCCYSGRAIPSMMSPEMPHILIDIEGVYILASTTRNRPALAPPGHRNSAFTGRLVKTLKNGSPSSGSLLSLDSIYRSLHRELIAAGYPAPRQVNSKTIMNLALVRNRAASPNTASSTALDTPPADTTLSQGRGVPNSGSSSVTPGARESVLSTTISQTSPRPTGSTTRRSLISAGLGIAALSVAGAWAANGIRSLSRDKWMTLENGSAVNDAVFHPNGKLIAAATQGKKVHCWDPLEGDITHILEGHEAAVSSVAFHPSENLLASGSVDKTIRIWDLTDNQNIATLRGHEAAVWGLSYSPDGTFLASTSSDGTARFWQHIDHDLLKVFHGGATSRPRFSSDGQQVYFGCGSEVRCHTVPNGTIVGEWKTAALATSVDIHPNEKIIAVGTGGQMFEIWDTENNSKLRDIGTNKENSFVSFSPSGDLLAVGTNAGVEMFSVEGKPLGYLHEHSDRVTSVWFSPTGDIIASASEDSTIRISETGSWKKG